MYHIKIDLVVEKVLLRASRWFWTSLYRTCCRLVYHQPHPVRKHMFQLSLALSYWPYQCEVGKISLEHCWHACELWRFRGSAKKNALIVRIGSLVRQKRWFWSGIKMWMWWSLRGGCESQLRAHTHTLVCAERIGTRSWALVCTPTTTPPGLAGRACPWPGPPSIEPSQVPLPCPRRQRSPLVLQTILYPPVQS